MGKEDEDYSFIVIKTHKERYALAEKLSLGKVVSIERHSKVSYGHIEKIESLG